MDDEALIARLRSTTYFATDDVAKEAADRLEGMVAALRKIDRINDNPARFNVQIHNAIQAALCPDDQMAIK